MIIIEESFDNCFGKYLLSSETITKSLKIAYIYIYIYIAPVSIIL